MIVFHDVKVIRSAEGEYVDALIDGHSVQDIIVRAGFPRRPTSNDEAEWAAYRAAYDKRAQEVFAEAAREADRNRK